MMAKKRDKKVTKDPQAPEVPKARAQKAESRAVLAIRIPLLMRDRLRAVAGWGQ
jgi:hypothetical protein